jgi:hypothetical protein
MPSRPSPFELHAELAAIIRDAAAPLLPGSRSRFYEVVDRLLRDEPGALGPGTVSRACRRAQREFVATPDQGPSVDARR